MDHHIEGPPETFVESQHTPDVVRIFITAPLKPGQRLRVVKFLAYGWSSQRSRPAIHDQVIPAVTLTFPHAAADALRWRYSILNQARERARLLGLRGAAFPWRTIHEEESSGYWPASTAAFHINADIAYAVTQYIEATEDTAFEKEVGLELLVETARLWSSLLHRGCQKRSNGSPSKLCSVAVVCASK